MRFGALKPRRQMDPAGRRRRRGDHLAANSGHLYCYSPTPTASGRPTIDTILTAEAERLAMSLLGRGEDGRTWYK